MAAEKTYAPDAEPAREVAVVINLHSRSGRAMSHLAVPELEKRGLVVRQAHMARSGHALLRAVREAIESGISTIVIGGGDGSISSVVNLLARRPELTLGILPVGTGNEVARSLGIPLDLPGACQVIAEGKVATVDLGEASGRFFLHTGLVGFPARVNHSIPNWLKQRFGKPAYTLSLLRAMFGSRPFHVRVTAGDAEWEGDTIAVIAGNLRFHEPAGVLLPSRVASKRGMIVYTPRGSRFSTLLRLAVSLWVTRRKQPELLFAITGDSITVEADPPQDVDLDGEHFRPTPVNFCLSRNALRVLVP